MQEIIIDGIHNLYSAGVDNAIKEMMRVSIRNVFIRVVSYRNANEYENIKK